MCYKFIIVSEELSASIFRVRISSHFYIKTCNSYPKRGSGNFLRTLINFCPTHGVIFQKTVPDSNRLNVSHVHPENLIKGGVVSVTLTMQVCS